MVYVHANTWLMDKISDVDFKKANGDWTEMTSDCDSDSCD